MRIGIAGYGKLGRALERIIQDSDDVRLVGVFTRREKEKVKTLGTSVYPLAELETWAGKIDVLCLCFGSSGDMPELAPYLAERFNTVDTFDNHGILNEYKQRMGVSANKREHTSVVALGWDPGFLSIIRLLAHSFLPNASVNTFWGRGVSQGHSEALRQIDGVKEAVQYTVPREDALTLATLVSHPLTDTERHRRVCYICAEKEKEDLIRNEIPRIKNYFEGYETEIHFVRDEEFSTKHNRSSHRGRVYALGSSGKYKEIRHSLYLDLDIGSNPDFTASVMLAGARACYRLVIEGRHGAYSAFDIPVSYFSPFNCKNVNDYL